MEFNNKLAELRRAHGLTRKELAIRLKMSVDEIIKLENGDILPNINQIEKLSGVFEISQELLINNNLDIENILDKLYANKSGRISYKENVVQLSKKESIVFFIFIFMFFCFFIGISVLGQIYMFKEFNSFFEGK